MVVSKGIHVVLVKTAGTGNNVLFRFVLFLAALRKDFSGRMRTAANEGRGEEGYLWLNAVVVSTLPAVRAPPGERRSVISPSEQSCHGKRLGGRAAEAYCYGIPMSNAVLTTVGGERYVSRTCICSFCPPKPPAVGTAAVLSYHKAGTTITTATTAAATLHTYSTLSARSARLPACTAVTKNRSVLLLYLQCRNA